SQDRRVPQCGLCRRRLSPAGAAAHRGAEPGLLDHRRTTACTRACDPHRRHAGQPGTAQVKGDAMKTITRRRVLRGVLQGGAITVALPLLNCFLNDNGTAHADGTPLPLRYGTWLWGLGMSKSIFVPKKVGAGYDLPEELAALKKVRDKVNLYTNLTAFRDGNFFCHFTGWMVFRSGTSPSVINQAPAETIDTIVAN